MLTIDIDGKRIELTLREWVDSDVLLLVLGLDSSRAFDYAAGKPLAIVGTALLVTWL